MCGQCWQSNNILLGSTILQPHQSHPCCSGTRGLLSCALQLWLSTQEPVNFIILTVLIAFCADLLNLIYDAMPQDFVTLVVTEFGAIPPTSVPVILREYRQEPTI